LGITRVATLLLPPPKWHKTRHDWTKNETANSQTTVWVPFTPLHRNNCMMSNLRRRLISWHAWCIDYWYQPNNIMNDQFKSNYALLVRSEEKGRGVLDALTDKLWGNANSRMEMSATPAQDVYEIRPRKDRDGFDLIGDLGPARETLARARESRGVVSRARGTLTQLLGIVDHLRRRFACVKPCAHLL
jgi:hypothetical protein